MENTKKIQICNEIQRATTRLNCPPLLNKLVDVPNCTLVPDIATDTVCSEPAATVSEASVALDLKLVEMGKTVPGFKQNPVGGKFVRFCSLIHAERVGRWVLTGEGTTREILPLLFKETFPVCGESKTLEGAEVDREQKAIEFATTHPHLRYRDPALQKTADDEAEIIRKDIANMPDFTPRHYERFW